MQMNFDDRNEISGNVALEGDFYKSKLKFVLEEFETLVDIIVIDVPQGLSLLDRYIVGTIKPLEYWTDINSYESSKLKFKKDDEIVGGQISYTDNTPLTYGYLRKMVRENPEWIHYSGINYHHFGKVAFYRENGNYQANFQLKFLYSDNGVEKEQIYQRKFRIQPRFDSNDFIEKYNKSNEKGMI